MGNTYIFGGIIMSRDPLSLLISFISGLFRKNILIIIVLVVLLTVSAVFISRAVTAIAPVIQQTIGQTTELIEKVSEVMEKVAGVQEGFNAALRQIDSMQETIARIERIINRIPPRLLTDEITGEWDTSWMYEEIEIIEDPNNIRIEDEELRNAVLEILQRRAEEQATPEPTPQPQPPVQVVPRRIFGR